MMKLFQPYKIWDAQLKICSQVLFNTFTKDFWGFLAGIFGDFWRLGVFGGWGFLGFLAESGFEGEIDVKTLMLLH